MGACFLCKEVEGFDSHAVHFLFLEMSMDLEDIRESARANATDIEIGWEKLEKSKRSRQMFENRMEMIDAHVEKLEGTWNRLSEGNPTQDDIDLILQWLSDELYIGYQMQVTYENYKAVKNITETP